MNAAMLITSKSRVAYIYVTNTVRQGLEKMNAHGYSAVPVITENGQYYGCVSEGDFLRHILKHGGNLKAQEKYCVRDIIRPDFNPAVRIDVSLEELLVRAANQNFIPVVDDRGSFIGIITRKDIIKTFTSLRTVNSQDSASLSKDASLLYRFFSRSPPQRISFGIARSFMGYSFIMYFLPSLMQSSSGKCWCF